MLKEHWSWHKAAQAIGIEIAPAPRDADEKLSNKRLVEHSGGLITDGRTLEIVSLGGGHTNVTLRQVNGGATCVVEPLKGQHGKLNVELLNVIRPEFT